MSHIDDDYLTSKFGILQFTLMNAESKRTTDFLAINSLLGEVLDLEYADSEII